jgi:4-alpha-glucanotransferase
MGASVLTSRESGILLHPTSLPGGYGIGEIGPQAVAFADGLREMGQGVWQVLPLGPTSYGDSPYQSLSTFAGNPLLISFDLLQADGLLTRSRLSRFPRFDPGRVDYGKVIPARSAMLDTVCRGFARKASPEMKARYQAFCHAHETWLEDYALFVALKHAHGGRPWTEWDADLAAREPSALRRAGRRLRTAVRNARIRQFLFFDQWHRLVSHCRAIGVRLMGDLPIFVAHDSADVWAHRELFFLDKAGFPTVVAGVPPDYFSATGQRWGNPLYDWPVHAGTGFSWWIERMRRTFDLVDIVRIDHFRGFQAYWEIPGDEPTAVRGRWVEAPGESFFQALLRALGDLPIVAEDLGLITPPVEALRDRFGFPGMQVLQFAFGPDGPSEANHPERFRANCVCYTGTHDNDTTRGWFWGDDGQDSTRSREEIERERRSILDYLGTDGSEIHWDFIGLAMRSPANLVMAPLQDVLGLDSRGRMNVPGRPDGNWGWRYRHGDLSREIRDRMRALTADAGRHTTPANPLPRAPAALFA